MRILSALFGNKDNVKLSAGTKEEVFLVDVRTPGEFSAGSVKRAINIPLDMVAHQLLKFKGKKILSFAEAATGSSQAKSILEQNGFHNVFNGGTWQNVQNAVNG